jgi:hypothetical protein
MLKRIRQLWQRYFFAGSSAGGVVGAELPDCIALHARAKVKTMMMKVAININLGSFCITDN